MSNELHLCPVCLGVGTLQSGFYAAVVANGGLSWSTTNTDRETCRSCAGRGYVVLPPSTTAPGRVEGG